MYQNLKVSESESVRIWRCQNLKVSESHSVRIWKCQNLKVSESESVRIWKIYLKIKILTSTEQKLQFFLQYWQTIILEKNMMLFNFKRIYAWHFYGTRGFFHQSLKRIETQNYTIYIARTVTAFTANFLNFRLVESKKINLFPI